MTKKKITVLSICLVLGIILCAAILFLGNNTAEPTTESTVGETQFAIENKSPDMYTWEEYQALSLEDQDAFYQWFGSVDAFEAWMKAVNPDETTVNIGTWNEPGKQPNEYTWEEYQALSAEKRDAFIQWFDSTDAFEAWRQAVRPNDNTVFDKTWDKSGRQPNEYTWEEYQALKSEDQEAFYQWFGSVYAFEAWMDAAKPDESTSYGLIWNKSGKQPNEYTWEEYEALSPEDQEAFYQWFGSVGSFEAWMEAAKPDESASSTFVWNKSGKQPNEYTWEEYQALSSEDQEAFYQWFGSVDAFEAWMESVKPDESTSSCLIWNKPGKQPNEYTWEEYQALSPEDQDAFYQWFSSMDAFEAWMSVALQE